MVEAQGYGGGNTPLLPVVLVPVHPVLGGCAQPRCLWALLHIALPFSICDQDHHFSSRNLPAFHGPRHNSADWLCDEFTETVCTEYKVIGESELERAMSLSLVVERRGAVWISLDESFWQWICSMGCNKWVECKWKLCILHSLLASNNGYEIRLRIRSVYRVGNDRGIWVMT